MISLTLEWDKYARPDEFELSLPTTTVDLLALEAIEQTAWEYELLGLSADGQVMAHYRGELRKAGILSTWLVKPISRGETHSTRSLLMIRA